MLIWVFSGLAAVAISRRCRRWGGWTGSDRRRSLILPDPNSRRQGGVDHRPKPDETIVATVRRPRPTQSVGNKRRIEANQSARLLYRFDKAGKYKVWVKGFKSAAGGQFNPEVRAEIAGRCPKILDSTGWTSPPRREARWRSTRSFRLAGVGHFTTGGGSGQRRRRSALFSTASTTPDLPEAPPKRRLYRRIPVRLALPPHGREILLVNLEPGECAFRSKVKVRAHGRLPGR